MKYYKKYLVDVILTLAVEGKETDHCRWETRTLLDNHAEFDVSITGCHNGNQSIVYGKLLSVSLEK